MTGMDCSNIAAAAAAPALPAAATVPAAPRKRARAYTAEEQAVMRELNLSHLTYDAVQTAIRLILAYACAARR